MNNIAYYFLQLCCFILDVCVLFRVYEYLRYYASTILLSNPKDYWLSFTMWLFTLVGSIMITVMFAFLLDLIIDTIWEKYFE